MKIGQYCQRQRCRHVELEQFWHAFASHGFVSDSWAFLYMVAPFSIHIWTHEGVEAAASDNKLEGEGCEGRLSRVEFRSCHCYERLLCVVGYVGWLQFSSTRRVFAAIGFALKFVAVTDGHRRRSAFSVCFQCMTHAPVNQFLAAQTSLSRSVVGQNVMCM